MQRTPIAPSTNFPSQTPVGSSSTNGVLSGATGLVPARPTGPISPDPNLDSVLISINEVRGKILELLQHIENQPDSLSWTVVMDKFSVISSGMSNLAKSMKAERFPDLRKYAIVPYHVSPDADPLIEKMTEGRVSAVNHDNVPNYLRTKLDPEVEDRFSQAVSKVPLHIPESVQKADKQIQNSNKIVNSLLEQLPSISEWDTKAGSKGASQKFYNDADTGIMLQAMTTGKGIVSVGYRVGPR